MCDGFGWVYAVNGLGRPDYGRAIRCQCKEAEDQARRDENLMRMCELPTFADHMTFDTFRVGAGNREGYDVAHRIAAGEMLWLTLWGKKDTGKTHLALAICHEWLRQKRAARYAHVPVLLDELRAGMNDGTTDYRFKVYCTVPLLILDDLGLENSTGWVRERLTTIINERMMHQLPLVVTTNKPLDQLPGDDEGRIASRLTRETFCHAVLMRR